MVESSAPAVQSRVPPQLVALVAPDLGMERVAKVGRARWPVVIAIVCSLAAAGGEVLRVDSRPSTLASLEMQGQLKTMSDRQIDDQVKADERGFIVKRVALGAVAAPIDLGVYAISLFLLSWFLRGRAQSGAMLAVAAAALLPGAIANLLTGAAALTHHAIEPVHPALLPRTLADALGALGLHLGPALGKLSRAIDFFSLWSAALLAWGLAAAAALPRRRAVTGTLVAWLLWRLLTNVALGG